MPLALFLLRALPFLLLGSASRHKALGITDGPGLEFWSRVTHWIDGSETPITGSKWGLDSLWHAVTVQLLSHLPEMGWGTCGRDALAHSKSWVLEMHREIATPRTME